MTAYQILELIHSRDMLIDERGRPGAGARVHYAAASVVEQACQMLHREGEVEIAYMDTRFLLFSLRGFDPVQAGEYYCGLYRLA